MNSNQPLTGDELYFLYLENKDADALKDPDNLKQLLTFLFNNKREEISSNLNKDMITYCLERLEKDSDLDEEQISFLRDKYALASAGEEQTRRARTVKRWAAAAAMLVITAGVLFFTSGDQGKAGIFDFAERWSAEEQGESLVIETPSMTLQEIEVKEGHLPEKLPDEYAFENFYSDSTSALTTYDYVFKNIDGELLHIQVKEYTDTSAPLSTDYEINENSYYPHTHNNRTYYYCSNHNQNIILWPFKNISYRIYGNFTFPELEEVISLYEKEQDGL